MSEHITRTEILRAETLYENQETSVALLALNGINRATVNYGSSTTYKVFAGRGVMFVGHDMHILEPGAQVTVPRGTPSYDAGEGVVMWATSTPPFRASMVDEIQS